MHEYSIIGHPREKIVFYITLISIFFANFISDYLYSYIQSHLNIKITFAISAISIFTPLYWLFNKFLWKTKLFKKILNFPDLNGEWKCNGFSRNVETNKEFFWKSTIIINQTWDKIQISQQTTNSTSKSISNVGCIKYLPGLGYQVSYHYQNKPNAEECDLFEHDGLCTILFNETLEKAEGNYYNNGKTRKTVGTMRLERVFTNGKFGL